MRSPSTAREREGTRVPDATFRTRVNGNWVDVTTRELFDGKTVVVFGLPGAFTPTCSASHLPRFEQLAQEFRQHGVDDILCVSVNDAFVMNAWAKDQNVGDSVLMLADGNADFTKAMGLEMDGTGFGMGLRSKRYAIVTENGVVKHLAVENPGQFEVSSADAVMKAL